MKTNKMKPLYLDIGNSFVKLAKRNRAGWIILFDGELNQFTDLYRFINSRKNNERIILSSVRKDVTKKLRDNLSKKVIEEFTTSDIPSRMLDYKTPETLGLDRFLVCLAAWKESEDKNVIVIDAGSACTIDLMTEDGVYKGGVIMPGLQILKQTMKNRLPELPQAPDIIPGQWPGKSTLECIEWGVNGGFMMAIRGFIEKYRAMAENPEIYITGGNAKLLIEWMGNDEALNHRRNLIWDGLQQLEEMVRN